MVRKLRNGVGAVARVKKVWNDGVKLSQKVQRRACLIILEWMRKRLLCMMSQESLFQCELWVQKFGKILLAFDPKDMMSMMTMTQHLRMFQYRHQLPGRCNNKTVLCLVNGEPQLFVIVELRIDDSKIRNF